MQTPQKFYETSWFFIVIMVMVFCVSYVFWGAIFGGGMRRAVLPMERGLHRTVDEANKGEQGGQRGMFPSGGEIRRVEGGNFQGGGQGNNRTRIQGANATASFQR